jgi:hypothetical protein
MTIYKWMLAPAILIAAALATSPASAQTSSECRDMFYAADTNGDEVLSESEIFASNDIDGPLARSFDGDYPVGMSRFVEMCQE